MKLRTNILVQVLGVLVQVLTLSQHLVPPEYEATVVLLVTVVQAVTAWAGHTYNPDGTPAALPYVKPTGGASGVRNLVFALAFALASASVLKAECHLEGQFARCAPPYAAGEFTFLPNSWPNVHEILSPGYGDPVQVSGLAGDSVWMAPWTVFRVAIGYQAGKWIYVLNEQGYFNSYPDPHPADNMTTYLPAGLDEPVPADPRALEFMGKKIQEILDAR